MVKDVNHALAILLAQKVQHVTSTRGSANAKMSLVEELATNVKRITGEILKLAIANLAIVILKALNLSSVTGQLENAIVWMVSNDVIS